MGFLQGVTHVVAQPLGWSAELGGAITGSRDLTNIGHAVTSPNLVLAHPSSVVNVFDPKSAFAPAASGTSTAQSGRANAGQATPIYSTPSSSGTGSNTTAGPSAADLAAYNTYATNANNDLGKLLAAYNTANATENNAYTTRNNELQSGFDAAKNTYDQNVTQQNQQRLTQDNQVRQGVSSAYQSLLNMLGAYGGGGSSVALQWAPNTATKFLQNQMGLADQNAATNLKSLATNWGNFQNQFDQQKKQAADAHNQNLANNQSNYDTVRGQLSEILSNIANRSIDPTTIGNSLASIEGAIPNTRFVQPSYNGVTPVYQAPSLSSFEVNTPAPTVAAASNNTSATPLAILLAQQQKKNQNNVTPVA